jgi:hypothetical protein
MTLELVQDGTVTLVAMVAAAVILRRVIGFVRPLDGRQSGCSSCASRRRTCAAPGQPATPDEPVHVRVLRGAPAPAWPLSRVADSGIARPSVARRLFSVFARQKT